MQLLGHYLTAEPITTSDENLTDLHVYEIVRSIQKKTEKMRLHFPDDLPNFTAFKNGVLLADDDGVEYHVEHGSEVVLFPNVHVAIGQRVMLLAKEVTLHEIYQNTQTQQLQDTHQ